MISYSHNETTGRGVMIIFAKKNLFGVFLVSLVALSGCAFTKAGVNLAYLTDPAKKIPLSTLTPMMLFFSLKICGR